MDDTVSCVHAEACGACPLIRLGYDEQLADKRARVIASISGHPSLASLTVHRAVGADPRAGYRTRAKVMVASGARVGLFGAEGDHEVVDSPECVVLAPVLVKVLAALRPMIAADESRGGPLAPQVGSSGGLLAIDLREVRPPPGDTSGALVTWVVARGPQFKLESYRTAAIALREAVPEVLGVAVNFHEGESPQVLGSETLLLAGVRSVMDMVGSSTHRATFGSFVQAHRGQAERIHAAVVAAVLDEGSPAAHGPVRVVDLYGGSGAIALALAAAGANVTMVESFAPAVEQAVETARSGGKKLVAICVDVKDALLTLRRTGSFDAAVVNPPRRGLDPVVRTRLAELGTSVIVYVSCQPSTLARDLDHLARLGFSARSLAPFDMIPLTDQVETVAVLRRTPPTAPVVLYEDGEVMIVDKPPHEPTTPQGEHAGSLLARVQQLHGGGAAVPVHRLDVGTSGVVIFAKEARHVAGWADALARDGQKTYVAAVRGVPAGTGVIDRPLTEGGKSREAHTRFERFTLLGEKHAIVHAMPEQGRTHQIRRHLAAIGHPVLGDDRYGHAPTNRFFVEKHGLDRTFLHAARLELTHPSTRQRLIVEAVLPGDLESVVRSVASVRRKRLPTP